MIRQVNGFLKYLTIEKNTSPNTNRKYKLDLYGLLRYLTSYINITDIKQVTVADLRKYLQYAKETKQLQPSSIANRIAVLKSFFNYLHETGQIDINPAKPLRKPRYNQKLPKYLNDIELSILLSAPDKAVKADKSKNRIRDKLILTLFAYTGIRKSELLNLNWQDINLGNKYVIIKNSKSKIDRTIPLHPKVLQLLDSYLEQRLPLQNNALVTGEQGKRLHHNTLDLIFKYYIRHSGLSGKGYTLHCLRHTFATRLLRNNVNYYKIKTLLGHKSLESTEIYLHTTGKELQDSVQSLM